MAVASSSVVDFVIGGSETEEYEFPFFVALMIQNALGENQLIGGASIIHGYWLLTAAHCIPHLKKYPSFGVFAPSGNLKIFPVKVEFEKFLIHPLYDNDRHHDIALIKVKKSFLKIDLAQQLTLPIGDHTCDSATAIGYGRTAVDSASSDKLLKVNLDVIDNKISSMIYPKFFNHRIMICAGGDGIRSTFRGDSGGPLIMNAISKHKIIIGIISSGPADGAKLNKPACFTKVSAYVPWIWNETLEEYSNIRISNFRISNFNYRACYHMVPIFDRSSNVFITSATIIDDNFLLATNNRLNSFYCRADDYYALSPLGQVIEIKQIMKSLTEPIIETRKSISRNFHMLKQVDYVTEYDIDRNRFSTTLNCNQANVNSIMGHLDFPLHENLYIKNYSFFYTGFRDDIEDSKKAYQSLHISKIFKHSDLLCKLNCDTNIKSYALFTTDSYYNPLRTSHLIIIKNRKLSS